MVALIVSSIPSQLRRQHPLLPFFTSTQQASCSHFIARETEVGRRVEALGPGWLLLPLEGLQKLAAHPERSGGGRSAEPVSLSGGQGGVPSAGGLPATTPAHAPAAACRCPPPPPCRPHTPARRVSRARQPAGHAHCHPRAHLCPGSGPRVPAQRSGRPPSPPVLRPAPPAPAPAPLRRPQPLPGARSPAP